MLEHKQQRPEAPRWDRRVWNRKVTSLWGKVRGAYADIVSSMSGNRESHNSEALRARGLRSLVVGQTRHSMEVRPVPYMSRLTQTLNTTHCSACLRGAMFPVKPPLGPPFLHKSTPFSHARDTMARPRSGMACTHSIYLSAAKFCHLPHSFFWGMRATRELPLTSSSAHHA